MAPKPRPTQQSRSSLRVALAAVLVCAAVVLLIGRLGGGAAVAAASTTPLSALPTQHRLAIATFHTTHSGLWIASADAPQQPVRILTVAHKLGYGLRGAVSPDGQFIAYLRLPASATDPMTQGELWRVRSNGSDPQRLFLGVDMYRAPVWSPDSKTLAVRQGNREGDGITYALTAVEVATATERPLISGQRVDGLYPIGWGADNAFYAATITPRGTDILRADSRRAVSAFAGPGAATPVLHASDGIARDFQLAAATLQLAYAEYLPGAAQPYRLRTADLARGSSTVMLTSQWPLLHPQWRANGALHFGTSPQDARFQGGLGALSPQSVTGTALSVPSGHLFVPNASSSDGRFVAGQLFTGVSRVSGETVTPPRLVVADLAADASDATAALQPLSTTGPAEFLGWLP